MAPTTRSTFGAAGLALAQPSGMGADHGLDHLAAPDENDNLQQHQQPPTPKELKIAANGAHSLPGAPEVEPHQHTCRE